jgi:hypothetical protein
LPAELPVRKQLTSTGEEAVLYIAPPLLLALVPAWFLLKIQLVTVGEALVLYIPPPFSFEMFVVKKQLTITGEEA